MHSPSEATDTPRMSAEEIDAIRASHDIVAFIGRDVPLKRSGSAHKGRCPFHEEKSPSFCVFSQTQTFHCFGCGAGGDIIGYVMQADGLEFLEAIDRLRGNQRSHRIKDPAPRLVRYREEKVEPVPWPDEVKSQWEEGLMHSEDNLGSLAEELAAYRGWPVEACTAVLSEGVLAKVLTLSGQRCWAFPVKVPALSGWLTIGLHIRTGDRKWMFSKGSFSAPFILGKPTKARKWIIVEGQWDALSVNIARSPSAPHLVEPESLVLVGIRGASGGITRFLQTYGPMLKGAECILVPDADDAGMAWMKADGFFHQLEDLGASVRAYTPCASKDPNEAFKAGHLNAEVVAEWLKGDWA